MHGWFAEAMGTITRGEIVAQIAGRKGAAGGEVTAKARANTKANSPAEAGRYRRKNLKRRFVVAWRIDGEILRCAQNDVKTWATVVSEKKAALEEPPFLGDAAGS